MGLSISKERFCAVVTNQVPYNLALILNFNSLIAASQLCHKPVFMLTPDDIHSCSNIYGAAMDSTLENVSSFSEIFDSLAYHIEQLTMQPSLR